MTVRVGRRWFLQGTGGSLLAIPALASLLPGRAAAQEAPKRMIAMQTPHGGVWQTDMYPPEAMASESLTHPLHPVHHGELTSRVEGSDRVLSPALRAPADAFTESIASKMNIIRGLDVPFYYGHGRHVLGNYGDLSNNHDEPTPEQITADQLLAHSPSFYPQPPRRRLIYSGYHALSVEYRDRSRGAAGGFRSTEEVSLRAIFDSIYVEPEGMGETRPPPIDAVFDSYMRLQSGANPAGARLGSADRQRLTRYMDHLNDLRASIGGEVGSLCGDVRRPEGLGAGGLYQPSNYRVINDVILAAFMCDSSRLAVIGTNQQFDNGVESFGGYHEAAHAANSTGGDAGRINALGAAMRNNNLSFFRGAFLDLIAKLDSLDEGGATMLDNSLVWWAHEAGSSTHQGDSIPIVTAGGAAGAMRTGRYLDYRNREVNPFASAHRFSNEGRRRGACFFQWTTTYLDALGIPRSEWQQGDRKAFSAMAPNPGWAAIQYDQNAMDESCDQPLPGLLT